MQKNVIFKLTCVLILSILMAGLSFAATTGKIAGRVTDSKTGEALPGVNVVIEGTQMGAATDVDGYYFIINIRPGQYALTASMIGFTSLRKTDVPVMVDRTTTIDFQLDEKVLEAAEEVTIVAERAIVQLDVSSSQQILNVENIETTAYHDLAKVMNAQVGIAGFGANAATPRIRGSNYTDGAFNVDGMSLVDEIRNRPYMKVNLDAIQEVQIITGGFNAEYGNVRSGLINIVTKEGNDRYTGSVDFKISPPGLKHFGPMIYGKDSPLVRPFIYYKDGAWDGKYHEGGMGEPGTDSQFFDGWDKYSTETLKPGDPHYGKPYENLALYLWRHRSKDNLELLKQLVAEGKVDADLSLVDIEEDDVYEYGDLPDWQGSATFGGPVPFYNKVKFFLSHRQEKTAYARTFPEPFYNDRLSNLKLTTNITQSMKLNFNLLYGWQKGTSSGQGGGVGIDITNNPFSNGGGGFEGDVYRRMASANKMWYPYCNSPQIQERVSFGFQLSHVLSPSTFYEVTFSHLLTEEGHEMEHRNTIKIEGNEWGARHLKYGRLGTEAYADSMANAGVYDWNNWKNYRKIKIGDYWYDEAPWHYGPVNWRDLTGEYRMESCNLRENNSIFRKYVLKAAITSQINRFNQVKAGVEIQRDLIHADYKQIDPSVNGGTFQIAKARPWRGALYAQDKLEFQGMIANLGLRLDVQMRDEMISQDGPDDDLVTGPYTPYLQSGKKDSLDYLNWEKVTMVRLSPRVGVSHPISQNAKIFFNYGHFYRWPDAWNLYNYQQRTTEGFRIQNRGNPNLKPPRTIMYEVGYAHNLLDMIQLTATGYYKDITDEWNEVRFYPLEGQETRLNINNQYRDIRGIELMAELRRGRYVTGFTSMEYMISSRGRWGYDRFYEDPNKQSRTISASVTQPLARPVWKMNIDFHTPAEFGPMVGGLFPLADMNLNFLYTWRDGEKFTWNPQGIPYVEDNIKWRPYQRTDLRFTKRLFRKWGIEPVFYIDVLNLFNNKNMNTPRGYDYNNSVNRVLTGVDNTWAWNDHRWWKNEFKNYMNSLKIDEGDRPGDYKTGDKDYIAMPGFTPWTFLEKRDIYFGLKINFF